MIQFANAQELVKNGGLEDYVSGVVLPTTGGFEIYSANQDILQHWEIDTLTASSGIEIQHQQLFTPLASGGNYRLEFGSDRSINRISQILDTVADVQYEVKFYLLGRADTGSPLNDIRVFVKDNDVNGSIISNKLIINTPKSNWTEHSFIFTATSNRTFISFENIIASDSSSAIDNVTVQIYPVPVPTQTSVTYPDDDDEEDYKAIPGQDVILDHVIQNKSGNDYDIGTIAFTYNIPLQMDFRIGSITCEDGMTHAATTLYDTVSSGTNAGVVPTGFGDCPASEITYSNDGNNFNYSPVVGYVAKSNPFGVGADYSYDPNVRAIRITPTEQIADGSNGAPLPSYRMHFVTKVK